MMSDLVILVPVMPALLLLPKPLCLDREALLIFHILMTCVIAFERRRVYDVPVLQGMRDSYLGIFGPPLDRQVIPLPRVYTLFYFVQRHHFVLENEDCPDQSCAR